MNRPSVGLVIGTFAAVPYVHLALESWRRNYPQPRVLVSDDGSPKQDELRDLCRSYGAELVSNQRRLGWPAGDLASFYNGFEWAERRGLTYLVKMSRRFIPLFDWLPDFLRLASETGAATFSNECAQSRMKIRTECIGFDVRRWSDSGAPAKLKRIAESTNGNIGVERFIYNLSSEVAASRRAQRHGAPPGANGRPFEPWSLVPDKRTTPRPDLLWHNVDNGFDYCRVAVLFGLDYDVADFADVNQGQGDGQRIPLRGAAVRCGC